MQFDILTLFPDLIYSYTDESILGRAQKKELISVRAHNFRDFTSDKQHHVDDKPYGGGPGMILQAQPVYDCLKAIKALKHKGIKTTKTKVIIMDPAGKKFDQRMAEKFSKLDRLVLIAGRYEGFDARIYKFVDERISVGDFVLAGGELPALTIVEATARLIPGVLGNQESLTEETFGNKVTSKKYKVVSSDSTLDTKYLLPSTHKEYPQYTRPEDFMGLKVPKVLLSGNHALIEKWREEKSGLPRRSAKREGGRKKQSK